jgi:signal transduction histidine kinase
VIAGRLRRTSWRAGSLAPKLFGAFVAVLALASLTTLLVESTLTRSELETRTRALTAEQADAFRNQLRGEETGTVRSLAVFVQQAQIESDSARALLNATSVARLAGEFTLAEAFDLVSSVALLDPPRRERVVPPPLDAGLRRELAARRGQRRVVALEDSEGRPAGWGVIYALPFSDGGTTTVLVVGSTLDDEYARDVRDLVGVGDVELVVDGRVVATTDRGDEPRAAATDPAGDVREPDVHPTDRGDRLVQYLPIAAEDAWGRPAHVGLLLDDPLGPLDARLARYRALMVLLLLLVGGVLAIAFATVLTRPLVDLTRTATVIAGGRYDEPFEVTERGEIGQLSAALERMRRVLRAQLLVIGQQADALQEAARRVVGSADRERQRLAQDLHDGLQQRLVVLRMQLGAARARVRDDPALVDEVIDDLGRTVDELLDELRATAQALFPSILRDRGLGGALRSLAGRTEVGVEVALEPDPLPRLDEVVEAGAYFLASEAVTNALKHADTDRIVVRVAQEGEGLRVEVADRGRGFDPASVSLGGGLQNLRDRVNALGGTLRIIAAPGEGTCVTALLPIDPGVRPGEVAPLEVEEHGSDPSVEIELLRQTELPEDGVGVLLDRPVADGQLPGDRGVPLPGGHPTQDLELPRRQPRES